MIYSKSNLLNKMVLKHQVFRIKTNLVIMPAANQIILIWILIRKNHKRKPRLRKTSKMIYKEMLKLMKISEISKPAINLKLQTIHFRFQIIQWQIMMIMNCLGSLNQQIKFHNKKFKLLNKQNKIKIFNKIIMMIFLKTFKTIQTNLLLLNNKINFNKQITIMMNLMTLMILNLHLLIKNKFNKLKLIRWWSILFYILDFYLLFDKV